MNGLNLNEYMICNKFSFPLSALDDRTANQCMFTSERC